MTTVSRVRRRAVLALAGALVLVVGFDPSLVSPLVPWLAASAEVPATSESRSDNLTSAVEKLELEAAVETTPISGDWGALPEPELPTGPVALPSADEETVQLDAGTAARTAAEPEPVVVDLGGMEAAVGAVADGGSPSAVTLRVADPADAVAAGVDGLLLDVVDASEGGAAGADATVDLELSYAEFGGVGGGDWASRLRFVLIPECPVEQAGQPECAPVPLPTVNDPESQTIAAVVPVEALPVPAPLAQAPVNEDSATEEPLPEEPTETPPTETPSTETPSTETPAESPAVEGGQSSTSEESVPSGVAALGAFAATTTAGGSTGTSLAVVAGVSGPGGDWSATGLSATSTWATSGSTGGFSWSYPMRVPPVAAGPVPELGVSYSSATSDGRVPSANNQSGWVGEGFDVPGGFIERSYEACTKDDGGAANNAGHESGDLCWGTENASLVFKGSAVELIKGAGGRWVPKHDDGTKVELLTGAWNAGEAKEYWKVTTVDGIQYFFGRGARAAGGTALNSAWTVPVYGNNAGERCFKTDDFAGSRCDQVWRWNLDYVIDPSGNSMTYFYDVETNLYVPDYLANPKSLTASYVSGGHLNRIEYGTRAGEEAAGSAPAKVVFTSAPRCVLDEANPSGLCAPGQAGAEAKKWPDTPKDLVCETGMTCRVPSPVFFDRSRLAKVTTFTRDGSGYRPVDSWAFGQSFVAQGDGIGIEYATGVMLRLESVQHTGHGGTDATSDDLTLPANRFGYMGLKNRVDSATDGYPAMERHRVTNVRTESGASINVDYRTECANGDLPADAETNTKLCFPVKWQPEGEDAKTHFFHKYVVKTIVEDGVPPVDPGAEKLITGSLSVTTAYAYEGGAKWAKPTGAAIDAAEATYSEFRGFDTVTTTVGTGGEASTTATRYYRGTGGDLTAGPAGASVSTKDYDRLQGQVFATKTSSDGKPVSEQVTSFGAPETVVTGPGGQAATRLTSSTVDGFVYDADGALDMHTRQVNTFDDFAQVVKVDDRGGVGVLDDQVCTTTTYAHESNTELANRHMMALPGTVDRVASGCDATTPGARLSSDAFEYDAAGRVLRTSAIDPGDASKRVQMSAVIEYDKFGRPLRVADAAEQVTTTVYTQSDGGLPASTAVTTPDPDGSGPLPGFTTTTTLNPLTGTVASSTDANGKMTEGSYDALGRRIAVRYPQHPAPGPASVEYEYAVLPNGLNAVTTKTLGSDGKRQHVAVALYDGLLRSFQSQTEGADAGADHGGDQAARGRMISNTTYDSAGRVIEQTGAWYAKGAPAASPVNMSAEPPSKTRYLYDGAGRVTDEVFWVGTHDAPANERWRTTSYYDGVRTLMIPPKGAVPTETVADARGQTITLIEYQRDPETGTATDAGDVRGLPHQDTTYEYDLAGRMTGMTDAAGNEWLYGYDFQGRKTSATDPDNGMMTTAYDALGRVSSTTDATGAKLTYTYDPLGRKTSVREAASTEASATWVYDQSVDQAGKTLYGPVTTATRNAAGGAYATTTRSYDDAYRPVDIDTVLPQVAPFTTLSSTTFTTEYSYTADGQLSQLRLPAVGKLEEKPSLGAEIVTTHYDTASRPSWAGGGFGWGTYVAESRHGSDGRLLVADLGNTYGTAVTYRYEDGTNRLAGIALDRERVNGTDLDLSYAYDPAGNVTSILDKPTNTAVSAPARQDNQCFQYDSHRRLNLAFTPLDGNCARSSEQVNASAIGGAAPYWTEYDYDPIGNRTEKTAHATDGTTGTVVTSYTNGGSGAGPHQVTATSVSINDGTPTATTYGYDDAGRMTSRAPQGGATTQLRWDAESELASVDVNGTTDSFVYSADGDRMVRTDAAGTTVYLPGGQEIQITATTVQATRYYSFVGSTVAVRTGKGLGGVTSLVNDAHGTPVAAVPNTEQPNTNPVDRLYTDPFGGTRGGSGADTVPGDKQFLGLTRDTTGYTLLGARYYDETLGRFLSVDPILDLTDPQQWNGYAYAGNNPLTFEDASGLLALGKDDYSDIRGNKRGSGYSANRLDTTVKLPVTSSTYAPPAPWGWAAPVGTTTKAASGASAKAAPVAGQATSFATTAARMLGVFGAIGLVLSIPGSTDQTAGDREDAAGVAAHSTPATPPDPEGGCAPVPFTCKDDTELDWANDARKADHFDRHGADFGATNADEYTAMARNLYVNRANLETHVDLRGIVRVYERGTNSFGVFDPRGVIKTFYKPSSPTYWDRNYGFMSQ